MVLNYGGGLRVLGGTWGALGIMEGWEGRGGVWGGSNGWTPLGGGVLRIWGWSWGGWGGGSETSSNMGGGSWDFGEGLGDFGGAWGGHMGVVGVVMDGPH